MALNRRAARAVVVAVADVVGLTAFGIGGARADTTVPDPAWSIYDSQQVVNLINQQRAANHLPALRVSSQLTTAAHNHGWQMAHQDMLSHQCPGEANLGARITATGYTWRAIGENIGVVSGYSTASVESLELMMYNEKPPNAPHRALILSSTYRDIGVNDYQDGTHHVSWLTIDFALHA
jgi:uncharacterized protein YkwD